MILQHYLTVFADASYKDHVGGFGFYARYLSGQEPFKGSAEMTYEVEGNSQAETYALASAILLAYDHFRPDKNTMVVATSDSQHALSALSGGILGKHLTATERMFRDKLYKMPVSQIVYRHVKGHNKKAGCARTWVNDYCDKMAKQARLVQEKRLREIASLAQAEVDLVAR